MTQIVPTTRLKQRRVGTGSSMERLIHCAMSIVLPHAYYESEASERGTIIHDYLSDVGKIGAAEALALVPERWRDAVECIDLSGLDLQLSLAAEVALAYDCETMTARELGRGTDSGIFTDVRDSEIPARMDMIGVKKVPAGNRGLVVSWKTGWYTRRKRVASDWQLKTEGLAAARAYDLDLVEVQLINVDEGPPFIRKATYSAMEIDAIEAEVQAHYQRVLELRADWERGIVPDRYEIGEWCTFCPSKRFCPAQVDQVRSLAAGDELKEHLRIGQLKPEDLKWAHLALETAERDLATFKKMVKGAEAAYFLGTGAEPIHLGTLPDGRERYLGRVTKPGNENVNGELAFEVLEDVQEILSKARDSRNKPLLTAEQLKAIDGAKFATEATVIESSKDRIEQAVKKFVPKGKGTAAAEAIFEAMRKRSAIDRKWTDKVEDFAVKPASTRKLSQGPVDDDRALAEAAAEHRANGSGDPDYPHAFDALAEEVPDAAE